MDRQLVDPFIDATVNVLATMASTQAEVGEPFFEAGTTARGDVSGVVGFTGDETGTVSISFDGACILKIVSNMFGDEMVELNSEITDAVGEITNMISGQARQKLEMTGRRFNGAIPTVVTGKDHQLKATTSGPKIAIPFDTDEGQFTIVVSLNG